MIVMRQSISAEDPPSSDRGSLGADEGREDGLFDRRAASTAAIAPGFWTDVGSPARGRFIMLGLLGRRREAPAHAKNDRQDNPGARNVPIDPPWPNFLAALRWVSC